MLGYTPRARFAARARGQLELRVGLTAAARRLPLRRAPLSLLEAPNVLTHSVSLQRSIVIEPAPHVVSMSTGHWRGSKSLSSRHSVVTGRPADYPARIRCLVFRLLACLGLFFCGVAWVSGRQDLAVG